MKRERRFQALVGKRRHQKALLSSHHVAPGTVLRHLPKAGQEQLDRITAHIFQNWTIADKSGNLKFN